jgi:hypothetical protein
VITGSRSESDVNHWYLSTFARLDEKPSVAVQWLGRRVPWKVVTDMLILASQEAIVAIVAPGNVDDQVPLFHKIPTGNRSLGGQL